ncbi:MAG: GNAT family N-acetyltransferase [Candidatus Omnitrophota bacterium]|nr:MAG: GNAT family N-acetyltransferase [Candidatus Omnitrophota bacterium]
MKMCSTVYVDINVDEGCRWRNIYTHANRKNINKAKRNNIEVKIDQSEEAWQAFKFLYEATLSVNKADKFYFFSPKYFEGIQEHLADNYLLVSCAIEGKIISVMLVLLGTVYAHCHLIGTQRELMTMGVNNLLHHELILWCKKNGYKELHIGGGRSDSDDDSLLRFKKNFSDKTSALYVGESVLNYEIYNKLYRKR